MKTLYFHLGIAMALCPSFLYAQLYNDASANLPNVGAKGQSMDVRAADLDQDGDLDIILANEFQPNTLLFNDGTGKFTNVSASNLPQTVRDSEDVAVADFDGDGDLDLIFCSEDDINFGITPTHEYYLNDGTGKFTSAPFQFPDSEANAVLAMDVNKDGAMDVIFGNKGQNTLFINRGDGTFVNETATRLPLINRTTQDLAFADIDGDSDLDLFAGNENGNLLLLNNGAGIFTDVTATRLPAGVNMETRKVTFGDVDNDGDADVFLANVGFIPVKCAATVCILTMVRVPLAM
ncbi:MAG: FG-GAP repeat domain-containing protein [Saprospiraceae bacterium]